MEWFFAGDLWANLFAALVTVLLIERIAKRAEMEKSERSIRYVKGKVLSVCSNLMRACKAPVNWQVRIGNPDPNWDDYFANIQEARYGASASLERLLETYSNLMDAELKNDVFTILSLLSTPVWWAADISQPSLPAYYMGINASAVMHQAFKTVKRHKLSESISQSLRWKPGEAPEIDFDAFKIDVGGYHAVFEKWLQESIEFKDALYEAHKELRADSR